MGYRRTNKRALFISWIASLIGVGRFVSTQEYIGKIERNPLLDNPPSKAPADTVYGA